MISIYIVPASQLDKFKTKYISAQEAVKRSNTQYQKTKTLIKNCTKLRTAIKIYKASSKKQKYTARRKLNYRQSITDHLSQSTLSSPYETDNGELNNLKEELNTIKSKCSKME